MLVTYTLMKVSCVAFQVLSSIKATKGQANDGLSSALLLVLLDSAKNLPVSINTHTHTPTPTHTHYLSFFLASLFLNVPPSLFHLISLLLLHFAFCSFILYFFLLSCSDLISCRSGWRVFLRGTWAVGVWESAALPGWCSVRTLLPSTGQCLWVTLLAFPLDCSACIWPAFGALTSGCFIYKCFIVTSQLPFCM